MLVLEAALVALVGIWIVALGRLARTWRDAAPVPWRAAPARVRLAAPSAARAHQVA